MGGGDGPGGGAAARSAPSRRGPGGLAGRPAGGASGAGVGLADGLPDGGGGAVKNRCRTAGPVAGRCGAPIIYSVGAVSAVPPPASVCPAPAGLWRTGWSPVVFPAVRSGRPTVDGPGQAGLVCPGGTALSRRSAGHCWGGAGAVPVPGQAGAAAPAVVERGRTGAPGRSLRRRGHGLGAVPPLFDGGRAGPGGK